MINKNVEINNLKIIFNKYKKNYNPIINEYSHIYTYEINDNIVAFIIFTVLYEKCEIIDIFVLDDYRKKGYATALIDEIIRDYSVENITLEVSIKNTNAINLYKKIGFKEVAIRKNYYSDSDGLLMLKEVR